jgi:hypothetical protein
VNFCKKIYILKFEIFRNIFLLAYPFLCGVVGGVHGELPSENDPCVCRFRTAFNKFIVELLRLCLNDYNIDKLNGLIWGKKLVSILTGTQHPLISLKSILRKRSHNTISSSDGNPPGDSKIICRTSATCPKIKLCKCEINNGLIDNITFNSCLPEDIAPNPIENEFLVVLDTSPYTFHITDDQSK